MTVSDTVYRSHNPSSSLYYQLLETFLRCLNRVMKIVLTAVWFFTALCNQCYITVFYITLKSGTRMPCGECGHEYLLAFSVKRRHFVRPDTRKGWS